MFSHWKTSVIPCNLKIGLEVLKAFWKLYYKFEGRGGVKVK